MQKTWTDYQRTNFFRSPSWRWERVLELTKRVPYPARASRRDDVWVKKARNFYMRFNALEPSDRRELWFEFPGLFTAHDFWLRERTDREEGYFLQARLLAQQPYAEITAVTGLDAESIGWYEAMYFNVLDRITERDFITKTILVPALVKKETYDDDVPRFRDSTIAKPYMDGTLKLFSYFGGSLVADTMIAGLRTGMPMVNRDDFSNWHDKTWSDVIRRRSLQAAVTFEVNKYNVMELFNTHLQIQALERSSENQDKQKSTLERHIQALLDEIPWMMGEDVKRAHAGTKLAYYDNTACELRPDELLAIASGQDVPGLQDLPDSLPPPRKVKESVIMNAKSEDS